MMLHIDLCDWCAGAIGPYRLLTNRIAGFASEGFSSVPQGPWVTCHTHHGENLLERSFMERNLTLTSCRSAMNERAGASCATLLPDPVPAGLSYFRIYLRLFAAIFLVRIVSPRHNSSSPSKNCAPASAVFSFRFFSLEGVHHV